MNEDDEYCKPCSNYNTCFLVSCINHKPANPFSYDNPCPIRRVVYKYGIWNGALDYMTNFAKEQREKYNATASATNVETPMGKYLKESLDNFNFTDYFNALCDSLEEHYRKEETKMDYEKPNYLFDTATSNPCVSVLSKALVQLDKGEITLSEIANLAWILSDIYSDED